MDKATAVQTPLYIRRPLSISALRRRSKGFISAIEAPVSVYIQGVFYQYDARTGNQKRWVFNQPKFVEKIGRQYIHVQAGTEPIIPEAVRKFLPEFHHQGMYIIRESVNESTTIN